ANKGYPDITNLIEISEIFDVTIDELIKEDKKLQKEMGSSEESFDQVSDPGFYLGMILFLIGIFTDFESISTLLMFGGIFVMVFYKDILGFLRSLSKDFKGVFKD